VTSLRTNLQTVPDLTIREQKILNYHVSKHENDTLPVLAEKCMNSIDWSDLPHTVLQAKKTLEALEGHGLIKRNGEESTPTKAGIRVMEHYRSQPNWPKAPKYERKKSTKKSTTRSKQS
jgi:superfamily II helicase